jgi:hypothetical protein
MGDMMASSILRTIKHRIAGLLGSILALLVRFALARPALKAWSLAWTRRCPRLKSWLDNFAQTSGIIAGVRTVQISCEVPDEPSRLTPHARRIYADLNAAIEQYNKKG